MTAAAAKDTLLIGPTAWHDAQHKAMYGHKSWLCWIENEQQHADRLSEDALKRAMLAEGTKCRFVLYSRYGGSHIVHWWLASQMLRNLKYGYL